MSRRALRVWARQQHRLVLLLRARHPLLRRLPPGQRILEALGLAPHRGARPAPAVWTGWAEPAPIEPEMQGDERAGALPEPLLPDAPELRAAPAGAGVVPEAPPAPPAATPAAEASPPADRP